MGYILRGWSTLAIVTSRRVGFEMLKYNKGMHFNRKIILSPNFSCVMMTIDEVDHLSNEYSNENRFKVLSCVSIPSV